MYVYVRTCVTMAFYLYSQIAPNMIYNLYRLDINECAEDHGCDHLCNNTDGSFHCYCNPGYMLHSNGTTCTG